MNAAAKRDTDLGAHQSTQILTALLRGKAILVTGAGFSHGAVDRDGDHLPLGRELAKLLWPIAFGETPYETSSELAEIYSVARQRSGNAVKELMDLALTVDPTRLPERYLDWFALPWARIYTLNVDNLASVVHAKARASDLQILSGLTSTPGDARGAGTTVVHLNGQLADYPNLTFTPPSYGDRTSLPDSWYQQFIVDTVTRPTLYVGTVLDEPPIWHYLSQRGAKGERSETRPRSWLFTRDLPIARRELLAGFNINLVEAFEKDVHERVIAPNLEQLKRAAAANRLSLTSSPGVQDVSQIIATDPQGDSSFLSGREPTWGDVHAGYAVPFEIDRELLSTAESLSDNTIVLHGLAGSGKSTSMMRLAAVLSAKGNSVAWIDADASESVFDLENAILEQEPDYVVIDDLDRFAASAHSLVERINAAGIAVIASARTTRLHAIKLRKDLHAQFVPTPPLSDADAESLISGLEQANRLGALLGMTAADRIRAVTGRADRQLLVTLIEATSGRRFHDKVADECSELTGIQLAAYGVICSIQAARNSSLALDDVLLATHGASNLGVSEIRKLIDGQLVTDANGRLQARHRTIAESAIRYFRSEGQLAVWYEMVLFMLALKYEPSRNSDPYKKSLTRFLNHGFLHEELRTVDEVRNVYGALESSLAREFHYWLQRGSYELDFGDLPSAETFLLQAEALRPDDNLFETAWCHLLLKMALTNASARAAYTLAEEGARRLQGLLDDPTTRTPQTYVVYLRYGSQCASYQILPAGEDALLRINLRHQIVAATTRFRSNRKVMAAVAEAERVVGRP